MSIKRRNWQHIENVVVRRKMRLGTIDDDKSDDM
jgi:hypothetical protein